MLNRFALLALAALAGTAHADTMYWLGGVDTQWNNPANWYLGRVPGINDVAVITNHDAGPLVHDYFTPIGGLWIQSGASVTCLTQLYVYGSATIDGSLFLAGLPARFAHRDDVNVSGNIIAWGGAGILRLSAGFGDFNVLSAGTLTIPTYDTVGVTLGTALHVYGKLDVQSTRTVTVGKPQSDMSANVYVVVENTGQLHFAHSGAMTGYTYLGAPPPYIVVSGNVLADGVGFDMVSFNGTLSVFNAGVITTTNPDLVVANSWDLDNTGSLVRGFWVARDAGRTIFSSNAVNGIGAASLVQLSGPNAAFISSGQLSTVQGQLQLFNGAVLPTTPSNGHFVNHGFVTLDEKSSLHVSGEYYNAPDGLLNIAVVGSGDGQHSLIQATTAAMSGTLAAYIQPSYTPPQGTAIPFVQVSQYVSGQFGQVAVYNTSTPYTVQYDLQQTSLIAGCASDFNGDGFTDIYDFTDFVSCFEGAACPPGKSPDFNNDGFADIYDFTDFVAAFEEGC